MRWFALQTIVFSLFISIVSSTYAYQQITYEDSGEIDKSSVQLGPRPFFLKDDMDEGRLKQKLESCSNGPFKKTEFSIGHRGAGLEFPEHTRESYLAAAKMGAGIIECDVTFTKDRALVCRHSQCDLHTTTNILATPLAEKCSQGFTPAQYDANGNLIQAASAKCCTSDLSVDEFKSLKGKMDSFNPGAKTVAEYMNATPSFRTDLYANARGTLMTHKESIELFKSLKVKMTPELKAPEVPMPFQGDYTQQEYAQQMIDEYRQAGVPGENVFAQSFSVDDILYWLKEDPDFGEQGVYLDGRYDDPAFNFRDPATWSPSMQALSQSGVRIIAPPLWMLLDLDEQGEIGPSLYAKRAKQAGLKIITWTLERSGPLNVGGGGWYYQSISAAINNDGDMFKVLDVLAKQVGILGIFSDWPATVTYYANCNGL